MRYVALILATLALAPVAAAAERPLPWAGGQSVVSEFEAGAAAFAGSIAGRPVEVFCNGETDWSVLAQQGDFDPNLVWGYVVFRWRPADGRFIPLDYSHLSHNACWYLDEFRGAADKLAATKRCQTGTDVLYESVTVVRKQRVRVRGRWVTRSVRRTVQRPVEIPVYGQCPDYRRTLFALQTLAHESMHLRGIVDEGLTECYGMQLLDDVARWFGADDALAAELATDYWNEFYVRQRPESEYFRADCVDGSSLDLSPASTSWPAGTAAAALPAP
jgi:hypothetical protein